METYNCKKCRQRIDHERATSAHFDSSKRLCRECVRHAGSYISSLTYRPAKHPSMPRKKVFSGTTGPV